MPPENQLISGYNPKIPNYLINNSFLEFINTLDKY